MISYGERKPKMIATSSALNSSAVSSSVRIMSFVLSGADGVDEFIMKRCQEVICHQWKLMIIMTGAW